MKRNKEKGDMLPGLEMPEAKPVPKPPTRPCTDCPYYDGTYSYFDDRTGKKFPVDFAYTEEDEKHLKWEDYDDDRGDYVACGVFENRDVPKCECTRECDRDPGELIQMSADEFRAFAFVSGLEDPQGKEYEDIPHKAELEKIKKKIEEAK